MEVMAGYKLTEVGVIPGGWKIYLLGDCCSKIQDGNYGENYPTSRDFLDHGVPFLTSKVIGKDGSLREFLIDYISPQKHAELTKAHIELNDVLFTNRGASVGAIGFVSERIAGGNIGPQLTLLRACPDFISPRYLLHSMKSPALQRQIKSQDSGSAMNFFSVSETKKFKIPLPPSKAEQEAIAGTLSDADALIESLEQLIAKKRHIKQGAMQELLTGRKRLPGFSGDWEVKRIDAVAEIDPDNLGSDTPSDYAFNYISLEDVDVGSLRTYSEQIFRSAPSRARRRLRAGDILVSTVRPNLQSHLLFAFTQPIWVCSTGFSVVRCRSQDANPGYVFFHLFGQNISKQIEALITGSNYPAINGGDVKALEIPIPKLPEQIAIATILSDMDAEIAALEQKLAKTRQVKQGMMLELLTGRVRLI